MALTDARLYAGQFRAEKAPPRRSRKHLAFGCLLGVVVFLSLFFQFNMRVMAPKGKARKLALARGSLQHWLSLSYSPIPASLEDVSNLVGQLPVTRPAGISDAQVTQAFSAVARMLAAYSKGGFSNYVAFRYPAPADWSFEAAARVRDMLAHPTPEYFVPGWLEDMTNPPPSVAREDPAPVPDAASLKGLELLEPWFKRSSKGTDYAAYWSGLALAESALTFTTVSKLPVELGTSVGKTNWALGISGWVSMPSMTFMHTPASILKARGKLEMLDVHLTIQPGRGDVPMPVFTRFYWDEQEGKWLPWQQVYGSGFRKLPWGQFFGALPRGKGRSRA